MADREIPMPYTNTKVRSRINDLNQFTGVKFTPHNLRSTCGSFMFSARCSIEEVSEHLGHEDIQTTRKWYSRIIDEKRRDATVKLEKFARHLPISSSPPIDRPIA
jgi:integrase